MFKELFLFTLLVTLLVNLVFLLAARDKSPDSAPSSTVFSAPPASSFAGIADELEAAPPPPAKGRLARRLFLRSNSKYEIEPEDAINNHIGGDQLKPASNLNPAKVKPKSRKRRQFLDVQVRSSRSQVLVSVESGGAVVYESTSSSATDPNDSTASTEAAGVAQPDAGSPPLQRGIHVLVLNQFEGSIMSKRHFDTYLPGQDDELCLYLNMIRDGRLLIFAVKDEATFRMAPNSCARQLLQRLGSRHIKQLGWRDMWAFVVRKRQLNETDQQLTDVATKSLRQQIIRNQLECNLAESISKSTHFDQWAEPVVLSTRIELLAREPEEADEFQCFLDKQAAAKASDKNDQLDEWTRRYRFCSRVEGYGRLCDCNHPSPINFSNPMAENSVASAADDAGTWRLKNVPIVVVASNRPYYLYRMLKSLLAAQGVDPKLITVFIDGYYDEPLEICQLFSLRAIQQKPAAWAIRQSGRISHHYKLSLSATFQMYPEAQFAIIFEEDLDIAPDALVYFNQTLGLLEGDQTLYCVSAWNDQGYEHTSADLELVYRIETMPGLGWMLSRRLFKQELELNWPTPSQLHDWDMWLRTNEVRRGRECLIPDVSRTYHFGSVGTNINSYFQRQYFSKHAFNYHRPLSTSESIGIRVFKNLDKLRHDDYEHELERLITGATIIRRANIVQSSNLVDGSIAGSNSSDVQRDAEFLCSLADIDSSGLRSNGSELTNVIYINMIDEWDFANWLKLAKCWRIWDLDARGQHKSMWRLFLGGTQTLVIGSPASPYSRLKPADLRPFFEQPIESH